ncbi:MAG TPA: IS200/IS605 family transposase [Planctomycetota bacterium]|nr:IS200/IS605 family transposase [Planctomycetota bacterium]
MTQYRKSAHTVYHVHYHFVFTTKFRKPVLRGEVGLRVRELIRVICRGLDIEIRQGHVRPDHVHLLLDVPPNLAPSRVMQAIKGKTSHSMLADWRQLRREFWGRHLWARGYFVCTSGNVTEEIIKEYIKNQGVDPEDENRFQVTE